MITERALISAHLEVSLERASQRLREVWAQRIVCEEGVVLKAGESFYGDWNLSWVKACDVMMTRGCIVIHVYAAVEGLRAWIWRYD